MKAYRIKKRIASEGDLHLSALPFEQGELVEVIVLSCEQEEHEPVSLHGTLKHYDRPTEPVAAEDWDALQ